MFDLFISYCTLLLGTKDPWSFAEWSGDPASKKRAQPRSLSVCFLAPKSCVTFEESFPIDWYSQYGLKRLDVVRISSVTTTRITTPDNWDVLWYTPLTNHNSRVFWQHLKSKHWISLDQTSSYFLHLFAGEFRCFGESISIESLEKTGSDVPVFVQDLVPYFQQNKATGLWPLPSGKHTKTIKKLWKITIFKI